MRALFTIIFATIKEAFGFGKARQSRKEVMQPLIKIEHDEEKQIRKAAAAKEVKIESIALIKAHEKLVKYQNKTGLKVLIDDNGEYQVLKQDVLDLLPKDDKIEFSNRRKEKGKLIGRFKEKRKTKNSQ